MKFFNFLILTDGPMARSVADLRLGLSILAGRHPLRPTGVRKRVSDSAGVSRPGYLTRPP